MESQKNIVLVNLQLIFSQKNWLEHFLETFEREKDLSKLFYDIKF